MVVQMMLVLIYVITPALILMLCRRYAFFTKIGEVVLAYVVGIVIGCSGLFSEQEYGSLQDLIIMATIPVSIPLMLFSSDSKQWLKMAGSTVLSLVIAVVAIVVMVVSGYFVFKGAYHQEYFKIAGLMVGVYTGGTPNLASLKLVLNVDESTYIAVHTYDMLISAVYLFLLMSLGLKVFGLFLPVTTSDETEDQELNHIGKYFYLFNFKKDMKSILLGLILSVVVLLVGAGLMLLVAEKSQMAVLILAITTMGIVLSFIPSVNKIKYTFDTGMYLILIFSMVVASKVSIRELMNIDVNLFSYIAYVMLGSLILHVLMAHFFKLDASIVIVTSTALICSPPFVPVVAGAIKNRSVIVPGLTVGVIGYAIGTYLGFLIASLIQNI